MSIIFSFGTNRHPREAEAEPVSWRLGQPTIALLLAAAFPIGSPAAAQTAQPQAIYFARVEGSYLHAFDTVPGFALGSDFNQRSQVRGLIEAGIIF